MKKSFCFISLTFMFLASCAPMSTPPLTNTPIPTNTNQPTDTLTPINIPTRTPRSTVTPISIIYVELLSPFASDCGNGIPIIRANASFNGLDRYPECIDPEHGHSDFWVPIGCDVNLYDGEVIAPIEGDLVSQPGYSTFWLPRNILPVGIERALEFAGIENPDISKIESIRLELGHFEPLRTGHFEQGEPMGNIIPVNPSGRLIQTMLAYWVGVVYNGKGYALSPALFLQHKTDWICIDGITLPGQCEPISNNYPASCK